MFKSKRRQIVTPQSEHLKLVGTLAMLWGNDQFDHPPIESKSMISGMGLHDRGYGYLDNYPIGGMTAEEWLPIARRDLANATTRAQQTVSRHRSRSARARQQPSAGGRL